MRVVPMSLSLRIRYTHYNRTTGERKENEHGAEGAQVLVVTDTHCQGIFSGIGLLKRVIKERG
jgi:hypothetical protein